MQLISQVWN